MLFHGPLALMCTESTVHYMWGGSGLLFAHLRRLTLTHSMQTQIGNVSTTLSQLGKIVYSM